MKRQQLVDVITVVKDFASNEKFSYPWVLISTEYEGKVCAFADRGYAKIGTSVDVDAGTERFVFKINVVKLHEALSVLREEDVSVTVVGTEAIFKTKRQKATLSVLGIDDSVLRMNEFFAETDLGLPSVTIPKKEMKTIMGYGTSMGSFPPPENGVPFNGAVWFRPEYTCVTKHGSQREVVFLKTVQSAIDFHLYGKVGQSIDPKSDVIALVKENIVNLIFDNTRISYPLSQQLSSLKFDKTFWSAGPFESIGHIILPDMGNFAKFGTAALVWHADTKIVKQAEWHECQYTEEIIGDLCTDMCTGMLPVRSGEFDVSIHPSCYKFDNPEITMIVGKMKLA